MVIENPGENAYGFLMEHFQELHRQLCSTRTTKGSSSETYAFVSTWLTHIVGDGKLTLKQHKDACNAYLKIASKYREMLMPPEGEVSCNYNDSSGSIVHSHIRPDSYTETTPVFKLDQSLRLVIPVSINSKDGVRRFSILDTKVTGIADYVLPARNISKTKELKLLNLFYDNASWVIDNKESCFGEIIRVVKGKYSCMLGIGVLTAESEEHKKALNTNFYSRPTVTVKKNNRELKVVDDQDLVKEFLNKSILEIPVSSSMVNQLANNKDGHTLVGSPREYINGDAVVFYSQSRVGNEISVVETKPCESCPNFIRRLGYKPRCIFMSKMCEGVEAPKQGELSWKKSKK
jgi:hypothetical protein